MSENDLPDGWASKPLLEICEIVRGVSYAKGEAATEPRPNHTPLLRANNIAGEIQYRDLQYVPRTRVDARQLLRVGDVIVAMSSGSKAVVGKAAQIRTPWDGTFGAFCGVLRPSQGIEPGYFGLFFQTTDYRTAISEASAGTNINNLKRAHFDAFQFPLPPLVEQKRIVAKVEELLKRVNEARERLARMPFLMKRFRQAVLAAACDGRLSADWRERRRDATSSAALVARLTKEHAAYGAGRSNAAPPSDGAHDLEPSDFPETWKLADLATLCEPGRPITYGILKPGPHLPDGVPYVRVADFPKDQISDLAGVRRTSKRIASDYQRATLRTGDVLLAIRGTYGRVCRVPKELSGGNITQDTARLTIHSCMNPDYVAWNLRGPSAQDRMKRAAKGVAVHGINIGDVRALQIPVPPPEEQAEIVRRVVELFALADAIDRQVATATKSANKLTQAILAKAFRGELVPTEAALTRNASPGATPTGQDAGGPGEA